VPISYSTIRGIDPPRYHLFDVDDLGMILGIGLSPTFTKYGPWNPGWSLDKGKVKIQENP